MLRHSWLAVASTVVLAAAVLLCTIPSLAAPTAAAPKTKKPPAGADVFGLEKVWQVHLALTADEYRAMQPAQVGFAFGGPPASPVPKPESKPGARETHRSVFGTEFPWAVASFTAGGTTVEKVGLRYKGNSTYLATSRVLKRSLKVDLDRHDESARFRGLKSLNLHCGVMDPSKGREALAYAIYRAAGVPAPRTAFAEVTLTVPGKYDKEYVGLYTLTESVDKNFLKMHYKDDKGLLMKPERLRGLDYLGDDWARYKNTYQPKRDATDAEIKRVIEFAKLVNLGTDAQFRREIAGFLDLDAFLKYMAVTAIVANLDSFFTLGHNYCLYLHPQTNQFHFIPWDVDLSLGNFGWFGTADQQMDLSINKPYSANKLADRVMAQPEFAERYRAILKDVLPLCFDKAKVLKDIDAIEKAVKPLVAKEAKAVAARREGAGGVPFAQPAPDLRKFVEKRSESIAAQLAGKSKGYAPAMFGMGGPPPARPLPGDVLPPNVQGQLQMTDEQKRRLAELQKKVDAELEQILSAEQRLQLKRLRATQPGPGFGPPGGFPPRKP